uniref:Putative secreted protein n=1 Tax=Lutzomyia longipalpis TaxID=7200 RepID=A0A7G3AM23_LUTLO
METTGIFKSACILSIAGTGLAAFLWWFKATKKLDIFPFELMDLKLSPKLYCRTLPRYILTQNVSRPVRRFLPNIVHGTYSQDFIPLSLTQSSIIL